MMGGDPVRGGRGGMAAISTGVVVAALSWNALTELGSTASAVEGRVRTLAAVLVLVSGLMTVQAVRESKFSLAWACYWLWAFVFLGLAPAYQLAHGRFPWFGAFEIATVVRGQTIVLVGHAAVLGAAVWTRRCVFRRGAVSALPAANFAHRAIVFLLAVQVACSGIFASLMGPLALVSGRAVFRERLLEIGALPGGGTLYFLATASAISVPAIAIVSRRSGAPVPIAMIWFSIALGFVVTNPMIGSRFLTGSFLVSVAGACIGHRAAVRYLPLGMIALLVTVFPSLDVLRGDGTGAVKVEALAPAQTLTSFDFDAFEMLLRAIVVGGGPGAETVDVVTVVIAPVLRWVPFLSDSVAGSASGSLVARATGMGYTNVSMPLWGEGFLIAGLVGTAVIMGLFGIWIGVVRTGLGKVASGGQATLDAPTAALLFIVLRGSLYEVLGYLLFAVAAWLLLKRSARSRVPRRFAVSNGRGRKSDDVGMVSA